MVWGLRLPAPGVGVGHRRVCAGQPKLLVPVLHRSIVQRPADRHSGCVDLLERVCASVLPSLADTPRMVMWADATLDNGQPSAALAVASGTGTRFVYRAVSTSADVNIWLSSSVGRLTVLASLFAPDQQCVRGGDGLPVCSDYLVSTFDTGGTCSCLS